MDFYSAFTSPEDGWFQTMERYVADDGDVNTRHPESGWTLMHVAAEFRQTDTIQLLVQHGADVNARDHQGMTPLHRAVNADIDQAIQMGERITFSTAKSLVELGAHSSIPDHQGKTPRDIAKVYGMDVLTLYDTLVGVE